MTIMKLTPVIVTEAIEPQLALWRDRLGYQVVAEVPHGDGLGFAILVQGKVEVMLQTYASVADDLPQIVPHLPKPRAAYLFHEVEDLDATRERLGGTTLLAGPRTTPYGMREVFVLVDGFVHGYAQKV